MFFPARFQNALEFLHYEQEAHFVLTRKRKRDGSFKRPLIGWKTHKPDPKQILNHLSRPDAGLGIFPSSVASTVIDVDGGQPELLFSLIGFPFVGLPTTRGVHGFYDAVDNPPAKTTGFELCDIGLVGDFIGADDFTLLHSYKSVEKLSESLRNRNPAPLDVIPLGPKLQSGSNDYCQYVHSTAAQRWRNIKRHYGFVTENLISQWFALNREIACRRKLGFSLKQIMEDVGVPRRRITQVTNPHKPDSLMRYCSKIAESEVIAYHRSKQRVIFPQMMSRVSGADASKSSVQAKKRIAA